jgi:hypothetical protein
LVIAMTDALLQQRHDDNANQAQAKAAASSLGFGPDQPTILPYDCQDTGTKYQ